MNRENLTQVKSRLTAWLPHTPIESGPNEIFYHDSFHFFRLPLTINVSESERENREKENSFIHFYSKRYFYVAQCYTCNNTQNEKKKIESKHKVKCRYTLKIAT